MRRFTATLTCRNCGRTFGYKMNDAVMPVDRIMLTHPVCKKCRFIEKLKIKH